MTAAVLTLTVAEGRRGCQLECGQSDSLAVPAASLRHAAPALPAHAEGVSRATVFVMESDSVTVGLRIGRPAGRVATACRLETRRRATRSLSRYVTTPSLSTTRWAAGAGAWRQHFPGLSHESQAATYSGPGDWGLGRRCECVNALLYSSSEFRVESGCHCDESTLNFK